MKRALLYLIPTTISLSRAVVAILLFFNLGISEGVCLLWAVVSDVLDGYLARTLNVPSRFGAYIDPIADKLFAVVFVYHFYEKVGFSLFQFISFFARDLSVLLFGMYLFLSGKIASWSVRSFFLGKVATSLQFLSFFFLVRGSPVPSYLLITLLVVGLGSFIELQYLLKQSLNKSLPH